MAARVAAVLHAAGGIGGRVEERLGRGWEGGVDERERVLGDDGDDEDDCGPRGKASRTGTHRTYGGGDEDDDDDE